MSDAAPPLRAKVAAVLAAEPPRRKASVPGTSVPRSMGRSGEMTTSSSRSPSATRRRGVVGLTRRQDTRYGGPADSSSAVSSQQQPADPVSFVCARGSASIMGVRTAVSQPSPAGPACPEPRQATRAHAPGGPEPLGAQTLDGTATPFDQQKAIDTIRTLSIDGVQQANSGHPGAPMGAAPMTYVLWTALPQARPHAPRLARPRPLRALRRPRQHAALLDAPPDRLRPAARRAQALPPDGLAARRATPSSA